MSGELDSAQFANFENGKTVSGNFLGKLQNYFCKVPNSVGLP